MKDSFIGKDEINDYLNKCDDNKDNSLFKYGDENPKNLSVKVENDSDTTGDEKLFAESPYRFVIIVLFCLLSFSNGMQWVTFSPIAKKFKEVYDLNTFYVDLFSLLYMIIYPFVNFPSSLILDRKSMRLGLSLAALLTTLGAGLKTFLNSSLIYAYLGQTLSSIAQPFILNSPGKIAATWFRDERRVIATSICCIANTLGVIFGYLFPTFFFEIEITSDNFRDKIIVYLMGHLFISIACCVPVILLMRSKPKIPPSNSQNNYKSPPLKECLKLMFKNKSFIYLLISFTGVITYFNLYGTIMNEYFTKYGLNDAQTSYASGIANFLGIFGSIIISVILDRYKNYKKAFIILNCISLISHIAMTILLEVFEESAFIITIVLWGIVSLTLVPFYTCSMDFVVEITYPVGESISGGFIMSCNQITGALSILLCDYFLEHLNHIRYLPNVFSSLFFLISIISICSMEEKLLRHQKDTET